ncbi:cupin domain-containing protein [Microvirga massiliensis]|uniref:cupin domain-containing protein n=1 Tax=Microvirga massiliensis TaxID=1033741 RepID=UPI00065FCABC|nr:cupin domain-containing protein [Microvirga massiliensis]
MARLPILLGMALMVSPFAAQGEDVSDALSVEWQGQKPCEKFFEDAQIRIARCTFPPGAMHVRHSHPGYLAYVLSGGKGQFQDEKGTRQIEIRADTYTNSAPIPWHELTNVGDTTLRYIVVERKYEPVPETEKTATK